MSKNKQFEETINSGLDFIDQLIDMVYGEIEQSQPKNKFPQMEKQVISKNLKYSYETDGNSIIFYLPGYNNKTIAKWIDPETRILTITENNEEEKVIFQVQINKKFDLYSINSEFKDGVLKITFEEVTKKAELIKF